MRSVGQLLRSQREKRKLTLDSVQKVIKIHPKYIKALESDDYAAFEGKVHAKGFLKVYVEYLGLNIDEIMALWRRDYETVFEKTKEEKFFKFKSLEQDKFVITSQVAPQGSTGAGSIRETKEFIIHPDKIKRLARGEAIFVNKQRFAVQEVVVRKGCF